MTSTAASRFPPVVWATPSWSDAVERVRDDAPAEDAERPPEEPLAPPRDERDGGEEEQEVEEELDQPLAPLGERGRRLEVEEPEQVDGEEGEEEPERDGGRAGEAAVEVLDPAQREGDQEQRREHVREREVAADAPVDLLERDGRDRGEEEGVDERLAAAHASDLRSSAVSSTRVSRASFRRHSSESVTSGSPPFLNRRSSSTAPRGARRRRPAAATMPAPVSRIRSAAAPSGGTAARIGRPDAMYSNTFPESTPLPRPPASGISSSSASESRCSASEVERGAYGISSSRSPSAEPLGPLAVGAAEVAEEAGDGVEPRVVQRLQERPRVPLAEEAARVRDPEPVAGRVGEPVEVVEVGAVRDRDDAARAARAPAPRRR